MRQRTIGWLLLFAASGGVGAQESASFKITGASFNQGGHSPGTGAPSSAGFQISLGSIGQAVSSSTGSSASYSVSSGFVGRSAPPGEIRNLRFIDGTTVAWDPDGSVGDYALYRGPISLPFDGNFGACFAPPPTLMTPTATVADLPASGTALFVLVTARNRLGEESSKGSGTANPRPNPTPCP
jgi:hypothetical protein